MAKPRKKPAEPKPPIVPRIGDKVIMQGSKYVRQISRVYLGDDEFDVELPGTNLEWFRVKTDTLTFVERKPPARGNHCLDQREPTLGLQRSPRSFFHP